MAHLYRSAPEAPGALIFLTLRIWRTGCSPSGVSSAWNTFSQKPTDSGLAMMLSLASWVSVIV